MVNNDEYAGARPDKNGPSLFGWWMILFADDFEDDVLEGDGGGGLAAEMDVSDSYLSFVLK